MTEPMKPLTLTEFRQRRVYSDDLWRDCAVYRDNEADQREGIAGWIYEESFYIEDGRSWPEKNQTYARENAGMTDRCYAWVLITNHDHILPLEDAERMLYEFIFNEAPPADLPKDVVKFVGNGLNEAEFTDPDIATLVGDALKAAGWRFDDIALVWWPPAAPAMAHLLEQGIGMFGAVEPPWAKEAEAVLRQFRRERAKR